jgi:hypothetical protein
MGHPTPPPKKVIGPYAAAVVVILSIFVWVALSLSESPAALALSTLPYEHVSVAGALTIAECAQLIERGSAARAEQDDRGCRVGDANVRKVRARRS